MFFSTVEDTFLEQVKVFIPASAATSKERLWPFIEAAERKYILPLLGRELYDDLQLFSASDSGWSGEGEDIVKSTELLRLVRLSETNLAYFIGFDILNSRISDQGFQRAETENFKGLYKYQEENVRTYFKDTGYNGLDDILQYLEDYMEYFPEWENSASYTLRQSSILKDTKTFDGICAINGSRLIFLRLQPFINQVMDIDIRNVLGADIYDALQDELNSLGSGGDYLALAAEIKKPLAFLSAALLVKNTGTITDKGLYFESRSGSADSVTLTPGGVDSSNYAYYRSTGEQYLEGLRKYLRENFVDYLGVTGSVYSRDNDGKKTFFT